MTFAFNASEFQHVNLSSAYFTLAQLTKMTTGRSYFLIKNHNQLTTPSLTELKPFRLFKSFHDTFQIMAHAQAHIESRKETITQLIYSDRIFEESTAMTFELMYAHYSLATAFNHYGIEFTIDLSKFDCLQSQPPRKHRDLVKSAELENQHGRCHYRTFYSFDRITHENNHAITNAMKVFSSEHSPKLRQ